MLNELKVKIFGSQVHGGAMKRLVLFLFVLLMTAALFAQAGGNPDSSVITFHGFTWGTSIDAFKARMGNPAFTEDSGGFHSLVYENVQFAGNRAFMVAYFSGSGLEGGMYYFNALGLEEIMFCYDSVQKELVTHYGSTPPAPAGRYEPLMREMRSYETCWILPGGYIHLRVNTRTGDPVTLWVSFPTLTEILDS